MELYNLKYLIWMKKKPPIVAVADFDFVSASAAPTATAVYGVRGP